MAPSFNPDYVLEIYLATAPALLYLLLHAVVRMKVALKTMTVVLRFVE